MASYSKRAGGWRAQVAIKGVRESATFSTKAEAVAWANKLETELRGAAKAGIVAGKTMQDAFDRYEKEVSAQKKGSRWESIRLAKIARDGVNGVIFGQILLRDVTPDVLGAWRDLRLKTVTGSTVNREFKLLSHVFTIARREWKWIVENPVSDVRRPKNASARNRLINDDEILRITMALGFHDEPVKTKIGAVAVAFLFAIETAMRAGEICGLLIGDIEGNVAHLRDSKNGEARDVPLSKRAVELIGYLPKDGETLFNVNSASLDALFRKARNRCGIDGLTFHDTRHEAITRLSKKLHVLALARMVGHRNPNQLQTYYNETAASLAALLG